MEEATVQELFSDPKHPYTQDLIGATPILGQADKELVTIPGSVPNLVNLPQGCKFAPRCRARFENNLHICTEEEPEFKPTGKGHSVRCWLYEEGVK